MEKPKLVSPQTKEANKSDSLSQREAVFIEVMRVVREDKIVIKERQPVKPLLNETHLKKIYTGLIAGFRAKKITLKETESNKKKLADQKLIETYVIGLVNNWLRRDYRLNGTLDKKS